MPMLYRRSEDPADLVGAIHQVRRRWRYKLMLRGAVGVLGLGALALALSAWGLESWRFSPGSIIAFRIVMAAALAALLGWFIVRPLLWRVSDEQVAMYLEEHEPSLQAAVLSAVEAGRENPTEDRTDRSPALVHQGRIGEIIQAKPEQRRRVLEEAAGVAGLHARRHEADDGIRVRCGA